MAIRVLKVFALLTLTASLSACAVYPGGYGYRGGGYYGRPAVYAAAPVYRGGYYGGGYGYRGGYGGGGYRGGGWGGNGWGGGRGWR